MKHAQRILHTPGDLPSVQRLLENEEAVLVAAQYGRVRCVAAIRAGLDTVRAQILAQTNGPVFFSPETFFEELRAQLANSDRTSLRPVINATGIPIHTNLGRVPLSPEAVSAIQQAARYTTLEFDIESGERGEREGRATALLQELTGAEAALVVNNNAGAVVLALNTLALNRAVVVSRGELAEIGGSFRIADIVHRSGARLVEVGATNKTRLRDFAAAIDNDTAALLRVHPSNFRIEGFAEQVSREELAQLARERNIVSLEDLGSGALIDLAQYDLPAEPTVRAVLASGMDVITFSGDKLLGGPQAGIILGRAALLEQMRANPLYRALRPDKLSIAALEATLRLYHEPDRLCERLPLLRMLTAPLDVLRERAARVRWALPAALRERVTVQEDVGYAGGGALPREAVPTIVLAIEPSPTSIDAAAKALRHESPPIVARRAKGKLLLDFRTIAPAELTAIYHSLRRLLTAESSR